MADTEIKKPNWTDKLNNPTLWVSLVIIFSAGAVQYNNVTVIAERLGKKIGIINELSEENDKHNIHQAVDEATIPLQLEIIELEGELRVTKLELRLCKEN